MTIRHSSATSFLPRQSALALLLTAALGLGAAASASAVAADKTVASLGAVSITDADLQAMLDSMPPAERAAARTNRQGVDNWLRQRVVSDAILREARSKGWAERPEVKARVEAAVKDVTARITASAYLDSLAQLPPDYPSDAEVAAAYEQGKANFNLPPMYRVAQIYLVLPPGNADEAKKVGERARKLATQARSGDFAALARSDSQDKRSAERGGEVGTLPLADMLPEVREAVSKLKVGQVSEPVQAAAGLHIIKLLDQQPARSATLAEMTPRLKQVLRQQRQQQMLQEYVSKLAPADRVNIDSAAVDAALKN